MAIEKNEFVVVILGGDGFTWYDYLSCAVEAEARKCLESLLKEDGEHSFRIVWRHTTVDETNICEVSPSNENGALNK